MRSGCRLSQKLVLLAALAAIALGAAPAQALSISPTSVDLVEFESGTLVVATITLVGTTTGLPAGGVTLRGAVAPADETLLFVVEYDFPDSLGPLAAVGVTRATGTWSGLGWVPGPDVDWSLASSLFGGSAGIAAPLDHGQTSDVFFVSAASIPVGTELDFSFQGWHGVPLAYGSATVVPEPTTLALLTGGLALLARARRH